MCSYVFCDDMNEAYMRFASLSAWPYVAVIMGVWLVLLSEKPSCISRVEWFENHIYELRSEELNEGWSSQLYTQLLQLRKESTKKKKRPWIFFRLSFCDCKLRIKLRWSSFTLITSRIVGQQIKKRFSSFSTSIVTLYLVLGEGG